MCHEMRNVKQTCNWKDWMTAVHEKGLLEIKRDIEATTMVRDHVASVDESKAITDDRHHTEATTSGNNQLKRVETTVQAPIKGLLSRGGILTRQQPMTGLESNTPQHPSPLLYNRTVTLVPPNVHPYTTQPTKISK